MDSNGVYYTLSTISQSLAGVIGLLVAVVVYHIDNKNKQIKKLLKDVEEMSIKADNKKEKADRAMNQLRLVIDDINKVTEQISTLKRNEKSVDLIISDVLIYSDYQNIKINESNKIVDESVLEFKKAKGVADAFGQLIAQLERRNMNIKKRLRHSLRHSVSAISLCLLALPWVNSLLVSRTYYFMVCWTIVMCGYAIYCLTTFVPLVESVVDDRIADKNPFGGWFR